MKGYVPFSTTRFYHSIYCSLATQIGETFGYSCRITISFEMVFLLILMFAVKANIWSENEQEIPDREWFTEKRCCLPGLVRPMAPHKELLKPVAGLSIFLLELAIIDKIRDGEGFGWSVVSKSFSRKFRKARGLASAFWGKDVINQIKTLASVQGCCENQVLRGGSLSLSWSPTARTTRLLFDGVSPNFAELGKIVGTLVYLSDAIDDYPQDISQRHFNPFILNREGSIAAVLATLGELNEFLRGNTLDFLPVRASREIRAVLSPWEGRIKYLAYTKGLQLERDVIPSKPSSWWLDETRSECKNSCKCYCISALA